MGMPNLADRVEGFHVRDRTKPDLSPVVDNTKKTGLGDRVNQDVRDTVARNIPFYMPGSLEDACKYLKDDPYVKKEMMTKADENELNALLEKYWKEYKVDDAGWVEKGAHFFNKLGLGAQYAADVNWIVNPLWGSATKLTVGLARLATDLVYSPYYIWNTGMDGLKYLPEHAIAKVIGTLMPGGSVLDKMSLRDRQKWLAITKAREAFMKKKGLYKSVTQTIGDAIYKGVDYVRGIFTGENYDPKTVVGVPVDPKEDYKNVIRTPEDRVKATPENREELGKIYNLHPVKGGKEIYQERDDGLKIVKLYKPTAEPEALAA